MRARLLVLALAVGAIVSLFLPSVVTNDLRLVWLGIAGSFVLAVSAMVAQRELRRPPGTPPEFPRLPWQDNPPPRRRLDSGLREDLRGCLVRMLIWTVILLAAGIVFATVWAALGGHGLPSNK